MSKFELPSSNTSDTPRSHLSSAAISDSDDDDASLPYPAPLPRSAFAIPAAQFSASRYLSTLSHRHQTLGDLRSDLRARSALISRELLDLVNANYADFLSLGQALRGGEERVEEVRVGLLGMRKAVGEYLGVRQIAERVGVEHPFLVAQEPRLTKIRNTLLLDLGAALKQAKAAGAQGKNRVLKVMSIYAEMDEGMEAVKVLKGGS
ncbi:putative conserved oligomeric golgi complex subunit 2 protein [Neofusicoccum parvum UCRNP2]|uniref:Conserved oligomeric Golgi complex subunit 2 n=1 Tax=Botryosphaeria parva (strain UCR-NP2) TaxID=1287680 RepID=R1H3K9_BOTPV|nr:putative conserved oligomeric golgi complex subunit 2 protein [Neofusicoccum parvum UCRNP2]